MTDVNQTTKQIVESIEAKEPGSASVIPGETFAKWKKDLKNRREERQIFEHLVVMWGRLRKGGLAEAAEQMLTLARIGLAESKVEAAMREQEGQRKAASKIADSGKKKADGLKAGTKGVGIRSGTKKKR